MKTLAHKNAIISKYYGVARIEESIEIEDFFIVILIYRLFDHNVQQISIFEPSVQSCHVSASEISRKNKKGV